MTLVIETLERSHAVEPFDCGNEALNRFLHRFALQNQAAGAARTYVALHRAQIIGYYSLAVGEIAHGDAAERLKRGLARHPIPVMILARLAVAKGAQGRGIGGELLRDAVLRTLQAADLAGIRALVVHAKNDAARRFYERFDFVPSPSDPLHLFVLIKDLKALSQTARD
jgi:GNAT superfamily N-acetyltransferase